MIKLWEKRLTDREKDLKDLLAEIEKKNEERKNAALQRFYGKASFHLALTGHQVNLISCTNAHEAKHALRVAAREASMSYGGFLSINAYGGFTKHQLAALREYRNKYAPTIKVVLLPVEKLYFKPLTQTVYDETLGPLSSTIFLSTRGSGDYLGSTITMDTTLSGSTGLAMHLSPFIVPVGISAVYRQKAEAFDAELICDFTDGYTAKGSIDVRDGWIFWDNDISNNMQVEDMSKGGCSIKHISGDRTSAEYKALQELEKKFDEIHIHRTQLSFIEKENYYKSLLADAQLNRASEQPSLSGLSNVFFADGFQPIAILALSTAADFHWYTNKQNVSNLSTVKFNKRITSSGDERIVSDLPVNLCLVYNTQLRAYDRCTENEFKQADTMQKGVQEVLKTPECANAPDPLECATRRDAAAILPARESIKEPDNILTNEV